MVPASHVVVIALAANELSSPHAAAIVKSAREVLGPTVTVRVEVVDEPAQQGASGSWHPNSAFAWLSWDRNDSRVAHLRCFLPQDNRWVQRDVTFQAQDPDDERGRTLGFVIGSIFLEGEQPQTQEAVLAPSIPPVIFQKHREAKPSVYHVAAAASLAGPNDATSLGAWLGAERWVTRIVSVGLAGEVRFGTVTAAQAGTYFCSASVLSTFRAFPLNGPAWIGVRTALGGEYMAFVHRSEDDPAAVVQSAWLPKLDLLLHGSLELGGASVLFADLGTNYRFGSTTVYVHQSEKAHVPSFIGIGRIGVGARF